MAAYDAFISYSHAKDKPVAAALQSAVQKLGKPWYRQRALRVFRDDTSLSATPGLWPSIENALNQSHYLILLASPEAAASPWIAKEVTYWLDHKSADTLLIALTDGELGWDNVAGDFLWREATPLPAALAGRFRSEPKWVDLRPYRAGARTSDARFTELAADFAATIHGLPKDDLLSQEVRQQRRALALAWSAVGSLLVLAVFAGWQWSVAVQSERIATAEAARAERNFSAAKETVDAVIFDLTEGLKDVDGMRTETAQRILGRAEATVGKLATRTENDPAVLLSQAAMFGLFSDIYLRLGAMQQAADHAARAIDIVRLLRAQDPADVRFKLTATATLGRIGAISAAQGNLADALQAHREALEISRALASDSPDNPERQHDISIALNHIGETLVAQGMLSEALSHFRESAEIMRALASRETGSIHWRRGLSATLTKLGDLLRTQDDLPRALLAHRESLDISRALVVQDPDNTLWRRNLHIGLVKTSQALFAMDEFSGALAAAREGLDVARALAARDKSNRLWQRGVAASLESLGHVLTAQGDLVGALAVHREGLAVRRSLIAQDKDNTEWQRDVAVGLNSVGDVLKAHGDMPTSVTAYREALDIVRKLSAADPGNNLWQIDVVHSLFRLGSVHDDASARFSEALAILNLLNSTGRLPPIAKEWIALAEGNLAKASKAGGALTGNR